MEKIKDLSLNERPREKAMEHSIGALSDEELLAVLLNTKPHPELLQQGLAAIAQMDLETLNGFKGIGPAKAVLMLAAGEYSKRAHGKRTVLTDLNSCYETLRPLLAQANQLQYILLLISEQRELLAFSEMGSLLPDMVKLTELAVEAGAKRLLLARNGWPAFSQLECRYVMDLQAACAALSMICDGLMAVGPERFKMI